MTHKARAILTNPWLIALLIAQVSFLGLLGLRYTGILQRVELYAYDKFTGMRIERQDTTRPQALIVGITESDVQKYGWPLTDELMSDLLGDLVVGNPRVIGVDIYRDMPVGEGAERLDQLLSTHDNIIFSEKFPDEKSFGVAPPEVLKDTRQVGFTDVIADPGGVVRKVLLYLDDGERYGTSLPLQTVVKYLEPAGIQPQADESRPDFMRLGATTYIPFEQDDGGYVNADARGYQILLDYLRVKNAPVMFSLDEVLTGAFAGEEIKDQIVLVGVIAESVNDFFYSPVEVTDGTDRIAGVLLHVLAVDQLLRLTSGDSALITTTTNTQEILTLWLLCVGGAAFAMLDISMLAFLILTAIGIALMGAVAYFFLTHAVWIPVATPAIGWLLSAALSDAYLSVQERRSRTVLMNLFSRHVSPDVARLIWEERDEVLKDGRLHSQRLIATVLFTDLVGFTSISEKLDPESLMQWLNSYMSAMTRLVIENHGIVDKYIGDAIMAIWGVPFARKTDEEISRDAIQAVTTALLMEKQLQKLNAVWHEQGLPPVSMRVGIHTGPLVAGGVGGEQRTEYTVIGDTVNIASRLESYEKSYNPDNSICRILIGGKTEHYVNGAFQTVPVGKIDLKGREHSLEVHRVTGPAAPYQLAEEAA
ncbi:MAG: adenylate/guanylate cyclase domain-containing protein [Gammaproteobacteria bacterium]|nr:adenylate/guanylate cyclase domain-containing protein [Gammaproteobacteria bacterium]